MTGRELPSWVADNSPGDHPIIVDVKHSLRSRPSHSVSIELVDATPASLFHSDAKASLLCAAIFGDIETAKSTLAPPPIPNLRTLSPPIATLPPSPNKPLQSQQNFEFPERVEKRKSLKSIYSSAGEEVDELESDYRSPKRQKPTKAKRTFKPPKLRLAIVGNSSTLSRIEDQGGIAAPSAVPGPASNATATPKSSMGKGKPKASRQARGPKSSTAVESESESESEIEIEAKQGAESDTDSSIIYLGSMPPQINIIPPTPAGNDITAPRTPFNKTPRRSLLPPPNFQETPTVLLRKGKKGHGSRKSHPMGVVSTPAADEPEPRNIGSTDALEDAEDVFISSSEPGRVSEMDIDPAEESLPTASAAESAIMIPKSKGLKAKAKSSRRSGRTKGSATIKAKNETAEIDAKQSVDSDSGSSIVCLGSVPPKHNIIPSTLAAQNQTDSLSIIAPERVPHSQPSPSPNKEQPPAPLSKKRHRRSKKSRSMTAASAPTTDEPEPESNEVLIHTVENTLDVFAKTLQPERVPDADVNVAEGSLPVVVKARKSKSRVGRAKAKSGRVQGEPKSSDSVKSTIEMEVDAQPGAESDAGSAIVAGAVPESPLEGPTSPSLIPQTNSNQSPTVPKKRKRRRSDKPRDTVAAPQLDWPESSKIETAGACQAGQPASAGVGIAFITVDDPR